MLTLKESKIYKLLKYVFFLWLYQILKLLKINNQWFYLSKWIMDNKNKNLLTNYSLKRTSLVVDVGGYTGYFSDKIISKFNPRLIIYEPVKKSCKILIKKYSDNKNVKVNNYGLFNKNQLVKIYLSKDGTSLFTNSVNSNLIKLVDVSKALKNIKRIDLMSINIEGAEYAVLEKLISTKLINKIKYLQVQFHAFIPDAINRRKNIIKGILKTHIVNYSYPFVWESFKQKDRNNHNRSS